MTRVCTGSRLHFGMLSLSKTQRADSAVPPRYWGGVGLMIQDPGFELLTNSAPTWLADNPLGERILQYATLFRENLPEKNHFEHACHFQLLRSAPEHQGFGTGTQLALAVARSLAEYASLPKKNASELARLVNRGSRSAIGIHGFDHGGFLVEGGKANSDRIAPLLSRVPFPDQWRIVLICRAGERGLHGLEETQTLQELSEEESSDQPDRLCRLVLLGLLPALVEKDFLTFGEALYEFNHAIGEAFAEKQKGIYSHPGSAEIVSALRMQKIPGVGQSSWGPTLYAISESADQANFIREYLVNHFSLQENEIQVTRALNQGATVDDV